MTDAEPLSSSIAMSDNSNYDANGEESSEESPATSSSSPLILYQPPTIWGLLRGAAINLFLPFINGLMLGFGELLAHEAAFRLGWSGTKIFPTYRRSHPIGPGIEVRDRSRGEVFRSRQEMDAYTSLE